MPTSPESFNKVRDILRKLDRSIDAARDRRLRADDEKDRPAPTPANTDNPDRPLRARPLPPRTGDSPRPGHWDPGRSSPPRP